LPKSLKLLFPIESIETIAKEASLIISRFDKEHLSRHVVSALLTEPGDHKGEILWFLVPIGRDAQNRIITFKDSGYRLTMSLFRYN